MESKNKEIRERGCTTQMQFFIVEFAFLKTGELIPQAI